MVATVGLQEQDFSWEAPWAVVDGVVEVVVVASLAEVEVLVEAVAAEAGKINFNYFIYFH